MISIIFSMLGVAACAFLAYVFMQFRRELLRMRKNPAEDTMLTAADIYRMEAAWKLASISSHEFRKPPAKKKAA
jgi:hypothetical protein